jgi:shikimate kinase/3-dehydroquinate synthase
MTRNLSRIELPEAAVLPPALAGRSIVLVGLMGAGKTSIGRRLAARLGLPFRDADAEIELAAGCTIAELFARYGEREFREGERRVIRRLLVGGDKLVLATGGGAFMDPETRAAIRAEAVSVWLRCPLATLVRRVATRSHRPLLDGRDPAQVLEQLMTVRHPIYAEADVTVLCGDDPPEQTTTQVLDALLGHRPPRRLAVAVGGGYEVLVGEGLIARAGALLAPVLPQKRCVIVTDATVAPLYLDALLAGLRETGFQAEPIVVPPGEGSKTLAVYGEVVDRLLALGVERRTAVIALGGGVVGDLAGFAAATTLRGLPFVQIPTTLLAQVDSSVGGKTGVNTARGKNLVGAFHQPVAVLADTGALASLPPRELRAGYAEIVKAGLIGDAPFYRWCEQHGSCVVGGDATLLAEAVLRACAFKAAVVGDDERESRANDGRALLNLGHTFGHALEAEYGYTGALLHGEAVALGLGLAFRLSARLGLCAPEVAERVVAHIASVGLPAELGSLNRRHSASALIGHMARDKKVRDGQLHFVLVRGVGQAFTSSEVPVDAVVDLLRGEGCGV